ncbi:MAG: SRPBCC family protein [Actinobacteria bacterium]|nr:SRPBCC family protein [Actinomycetota bacterium]
MTIQSSRTVLLDCTPREALELVLDLDAYRTVDPKIRRVTQRPELDSAGWGTARIVGSIWHLPPAPDAHLVHLERWHRLTICGAPGVPARLLFSFTGTFEAVEVDEGTRLTHAYAIRFRQPLRALCSSRIQGWLDRDLADELVRFQGRLALGAPRAIA